MKINLEIIEKITEQINRYENIYKTANIDILLNAQDWFCIQNYSLASMVADFKENYNNSYYIRKISIAQSQQAMINEGFSKAKAEPKSLIENKKKIENELEFQSTAYRLEILLKQVNVLINSIQQRISVLKKEQINSNRQNIT